MRSQLLATLPLALLATSLASAQSMTLRELAETARERAARQRPAQLAALEPFAADLEMEYAGDKVEYLDGRFAAVAQYADKIAPLLLEMLVPASADPKDKNKARNVARVMKLVGPADYCGSFIDLLDSKDQIGRRNAIWLLGHTGEPRAARALAARFDKLSGPDQVRVIESFEELGAEALRGTPALRVAASCLDTDAFALREAALRLLRTADVEGTQADAVSEALIKERTDQLLPKYIEYFAAHARGRTAVADRLLPLATGVRLSLDDRIDLIKALGKIAPEDHKPTLEALDNIVTSGGTGYLEIAAAKSMLDLGDKSGMRTVQRRFDQLVRRARDNSDVYAQRAQWHREIGEWTDAIRDYDSAIEHSRSGARRAYYHVEIARMHAYRGKPARVRASLKDSELGREAIERAARGDTIFEEALASDTVQRFLKSLK